MCCIKEEYQLTSELTGVLESCLLSIPQAVPKGPQIVLMEVLPMTHLTEMSGILFWNKYL